MAQYNCAFGYFGWIVGKPEVSTWTKSRLVGHMVFRCVLVTTGLTVIHGLTSEETTEAIVDGLLQILLAAEIPLGGQHGHVTKQELNLLQFAPIHMAELSARPAKIVWREMVQLHPLSDPSHHIPNDVLRDARAPGRVMPANGAEDSARRHLRGISPLIDGILDPDRHRNGTDMTALPTRSTMAQCPCLI